jgi:MFS family permease
MSFFGAVFASLTLYWQWHLTGIVLALPFLGFALIGLAAGYVMRRPGKGIEPTPGEERAIMWSSIGEGIGLFLAANIVINLHRPDLLLPAMALVVGLHFLPIAYAAAFRPFYVLGAALVVAAFACFLAGAPTGGAVAGFMAAGALWLAAGMAVRRDWLAKRSAVDGG